jgi:two-component system, LuxR family, response regulator FixJ
VICNRTTQELSGVNAIDSLGTVFVVDDDEEFRNAVAGILRAAGLAVETYASPVGLLESPQPDLLGCYLLDLQLPEMSGLELCKRLYGKGCRQPFIVLSGRGDISTALDAMRLGAVDFIEKPFNHARLLDTVQKAVERDASARCQRAEQLVLERKLSKLTPREAEVLQCVVLGRLSKQIAIELAISPKTVEVHRSRIMKKLEVDSLAQLLHLMNKRPART